MSDEPTRRQPFSTEAIELAKGFSRQLLDTIPELEAVAVVFSYTVNDKDLPFAVAMGQSGQLRSPPELIHISQQLWRVLNHHVNAAYQCITDVDGFMKEKAVELQKLQEQINAAKRELTSLTTGSDDPHQSSPT